ncbi:hypothetical protein FHX57_007086 [Paraburkholderia tropica]|uniref:Uncharacterized protein n=1 Tax=Paraburkholderia tropica TaxID=92647 RepID=A0ABX5MF14_9BURK|nr:hypothetical protein [Paraburkholderia tropica]MBB6323499.1 hypothetical protein [Paraburkholderia tropica]PXX05264.1 hypothetical protein C7400_14213 [Paraburkholderia tropica]PZW70583.1 hypothetical protein C7399_14213 [Paraburkholderia tropica]
MTILHDAKDTVQLQLCYLARNYYDNKLPNDDSTQQRALRVAVRSQAGSGHCCQRAWRSYISATVLPGSAKKLLRN